MSSSETTNSAAAPQQAPLASSAPASASTGQVPLVTEIPDDEETGKRRSQEHTWGNLSYMTRVTMSFAAIAAMTIFVAIGVLSYVWNDHFHSYARENAQAVADAASLRISQSYVEQGERWTRDATMAASYVSASYPGLGVVVSDADGRVLFDSSLGSDVATETDASLSLVPTDSSLVASSSIMVGDRVIGVVRIWAFGSDSFLRAADEVFRDNSYQAMALASMIAIALATVLGSIFARNLVSPIHTMTETAKAIKGGDLSARTGLSGKDEISRLGRTFDAMAESVEKDRALERRLTTDVAHELRTPLMAIQATVEAMIDGVYEPTEQRLTTVNAEIQRLSRLVNALLKLSRLENRSTPMKEEIIDLGDLIESIVSSHEAFVNDSGLSLKYEKQKNVRVKGDADMLRQATANLISNAVRYTPEGGSITVRVTKGEIMANIAVEDTGIGLSPEEARMVFSRFWRADAGRNRESGGLGVGLAVVKEIVDRHGGWVQAEGEKGVGARFTIHVPLYDEKVEAAKEKAKSKTAKKAKKR